MMDVLASAAMLEGMDISTASSGGMAAGAADGNLEHTDMLMAAVDVSMVGKENEEVRQRGCDPEDPGFERTLTTRVSTRGAQANRNQSNEAVNGAACEEPERQLGTLTEDSLRQRAAELFPDGAGVPAVPPKHPPVSEKPTIALCMLLSRPLTPYGSDREQSLRRGFPPQAATHHGAAWGYFLDVSEGAWPPLGPELVPYLPIRPTADPPRVLDPGAQAPLRASRRAPTASARRPSSLAPTLPTPSPSPASPPPLEVVLSGARHVRFFARAHVHACVRGR
jgi:hypothetical protein